VLGNRAAAGLGRLRGDRAADAGVGMGMDGYVSLMDVQQFGGLLDADGRLRNKPANWHVCFFSLEAFVFPWGAPCLMFATFAAIMLR
jgi:hypothetical protein